MNTLLKSLAALALLLLSAAAGVFIVKELRTQPPAPATQAVAPAPVVVVQQPASAPAVAQPAPAAAAPASAPIAAAPAPAGPAPAATPGPSSDMTTSAWESMKENNYADAITNAQKCIDLFKQQALDQQKALTAPVPNNKENWPAVFAEWALNDVGTCYFIQGQAYEKLNKPKDAAAAYQYFVTNLPYAQCWDPQGWFWPPAKAAKDRIKALQLDTLQ